MFVCARRFDLIGLFIHSEAMPSIICRPCWSFHVHVIPDVASSSLIHPLLSFLPMPFLSFFRLFIDSVQRSSGVVSIVMVNLSFLFFNISSQIYVSKKDRKFGLLRQREVERRDGGGFSLCKGQ